VPPLYLLFTEAAPAKINLSLRITGRRADGYHLLDSLVVFASVGDRVEATADDALSLTVRGPLAAGLAAEPDNLVLRAARALAEVAGVRAGARITLEKNLPVASGIGGGSADAAATLRALMRLWGVGDAITVPALIAMAARLGADVPVCLRPAPAIMRGIGEVLSPAPALPEFGLALVNPGAAVSTADIFRARDPGFAEPTAWPDGGWPDVAALVADLRRAPNDLEPAARRLCPPISDALAALAATPGCLLARMSGSGATCFGLFATETEAAVAAASCARPGCWTWGGGLYRPASSRL
jgi:4-diphosphocytidyl-2-C-methyl-D-erythritol kinase